MSPKLCHLEQPPRENFPCNGSASPPACTANRHGGSGLRTTGLTATEAMAKVEAILCGVAPSHHRGGGVVATGSGAGRRRAMETASKCRSGPSRRWIGPGLSLGLGLGLALGSLGTAALIAPPAAMAYTARITLFVARAEGESFEALVRRSEIIARAAIQRSFDLDPTVTEVKVTMVADNQGIAVPILTVAVDLVSWRSAPDAAQWATYYPAAEPLLGL